MIASASYDGQIRIFDTETGQCLKTLIYDRGGSSSPVSYVRFSPNGKYVLASSLDGSIRLWDYMNNKVAKTFTADKEPIAEKYTCGTRFLLLDGQSQPLVVSGSDSGKIYIWDVQSKDILSVLNGGDEDSDSNCPVLQVDAFDNGVALVSVSRDGVLKVWDLIDKKKDVEME
ncbi:unnamed protein product [Kuraishia capsulata CBS 1993]|uniref:Uncharacterized protein n=1 Tax=Kuraishia capsulata CBS 1993 TaxID=1382522 RepID=W6MKA6_9ASCO|nr:uncharacterized protein KUCA_T00002755001 [Kuraishia capsulata CBS 1993]CDK26781.1 unnamed protein product [Kuraishia capsulata CBS 1993]